MNEKKERQNSIKLPILLLVILAITCSNITIAQGTIPNRDDYKKIRDAKDWLNPSLIIERDGVTFICKAIAPNERKFISLATGVRTHDVKSSPS